MWAPEMTRHRSLINHFQGQEKKSNICKKMLSILQIIFKCYNIFKKQRQYKHTEIFFFFLYEDHGCGSNMSLPPGRRCLKIRRKKRFNPLSPKFKWIHLVKLRAIMTSYSSCCKSTSSSFSRT